MVGGDIFRTKLEEGQVYIWDSVCENSWIFLEIRHTL
jgi:hypothetical protein